MTDHMARAWALLAAVMLHSPASESLRVIELFPALGQRHLLRLLRVGPSGLIYGQDSQRICELDLQTELLVRSYVENAPLLNWIEEGLIDGGMHRKLRQTLDGLGLPLTDASVITRRSTVSALMAEIASGAMGPVLTRMGFRHTSGDGGGIVEALFDFPPIIHPSSDPLVEGSWAAECWLLHGHDNGRPFGVLRMDGFFCSRQDSEYPVDLFDASRGDVKEMARAVEEALRSVVTAA